MTVKDHYDNHLGNFYSWYTGDFEKNTESFKTFCLENKIEPMKSKYAIDLGAGNGIQSVALAKLGFKVKAIDFNNQLLKELEAKIGNDPIEIINDDIRFINNYSPLQPELIICCGDTLPHLDTFDEVQKLISDSFNVLTPQGKIILTFRDYSAELDDTDRFIPVKSDSTKILTCFLEYFPNRIKVTDLLHELENGKWVQKVSSYYKTRITKEFVINCLKESGFDIIADEIENRIISIIAQKND